MGTWDAGILDNDTALDGLGDLGDVIAADIERFGTLTPSATSTAALGAAVGVLLQLSPYEFGLETATGPKIAAAVGAHANEIARLAAPAREVLEAIARGEGAGLADRPGTIAQNQLELLKAAGQRSPFSQREAALFDSKAAAAYVQEVADRCVSAVDDDFADEDNWSDLCREGCSLGCLAVLLVLEPCTVPATRLKSWRASVATGLAALEERADEELPFHRDYYRNLDQVLAALEARYST